MNFWGHNFTDFKSVERICWACGYVIDRNNNEDEVKKWIRREEGCDLHCGGSWHKHRRVASPHSRPKPAATPRPDEMREALAALVMFLRGTNTLSTRGAEIEISRLCRNADAALAGPSVSRPQHSGDGK